MMLIDKGYYDYDYDSKVIDKKPDYTDTVKTDEEVSSMLSRFGIGKPKEEIKNMNPEEIQEYAMNN